MALATYSDLQASVANWLHRSDLTSIIPDFIALAEARIARDLRIRNQIASTTLLTAAGVQAVALPTGWLEFENITITSSPDISPVFVNIQHLNKNYPNNDYTGVPQVYTIEANTIMFGPIPDAAYSVPVLYYKKFDPLSTTPTNWLLTNHPSIYLYATMAEAMTYTQEDERVAFWEQKYAKDVQDLQTADDAAQFSGSALSVKVR
jgi:hypothetical protein